jgi:hypothetical protein
MAAGLKMDFTREVVCDAGVVPSCWLSGRGRSPSRLRRRARFVEGLIADGTHAAQDLVLPPVTGRGVEDGHRPGVEGAGIDHRRNRRRMARSGPLRTLTSSAQRSRSEAGGRAARASGPLERASSTPEYVHGSWEHMIVGRIHSMISSARVNTGCGIVRPSVLAVLRLMISSNVVGCSTGRSAGFAPLRILSTYAVERRQ